MRKTNIILFLLGVTLFFMVMTFLYSIIIYTENNPDILAPFIPLIVFSGFLIFLIGAILLSLSIAKMIDRK